MRDEEEAPHDSGEKDLFERIVELVEQALDGDPAEFEALSLDVFGYQYANNESYREFCDASGATPSSMRSSRHSP